MDIHPVSNIPIGWDALNCLSFKTDKVNGSEEVLKLDEQYVGYFYKNENEFDSWLECSMVKCQIDNLYSNFSLKIHLFS